ncbi:MAG: TetR/AcrR family transcriptional regulator [bacterium]|nr:TetR/AcrR family transcriptional regulator [bacterium]
MESSPSRERVLDVAEQLFTAHGYASVTMRDIAGKLEMKVSSLYHHVPKGKEELFVAVIERNMRRHHEELQRIIAQQEGDWQAQLFGVAHWLLSRPMMDSNHLMRTDIHELKEPQHAENVMQSMYMVMQPIEQIFARAAAETGKDMPHPGLLAGVFLAIVNGLSGAPEPFDPAFNKVTSVDTILKVLIKGLLAD